MLHHMKLQPEHFRKVMAGDKTIELRLNDTKRQRILVGDKIEFLNMENRTLKIRVGVVAIHHFASFEELYRQADIALYAAKMAGRDCYRTYSPEMKYPTEMEGT